MTLSSVELLRRFALHVMVGDVVRVRQCGLLAHRGRKERLALCRRLLTESAVPVSGHNNVVDLRDYYASPAAGFARPRLKPAAQWRRGPGIFGPDGSHSLPPAGLAARLHARLAPAKTLLCLWPGRSADDLGKAASACCQSPAQERARYLMSNDSPSDRPAIKTGSRPQQPRCARLPRPRPRCRPFTMAAKITTLLWPLPLVCTEKSNRLLASERAIPIQYPK